MKYTKDKGITRVDSAKTHGWFVRIYRAPKLTFSKLFSDGVYGGLDPSYNIAVKFRDLADETLPNTNYLRYVTQTSNHSSTGLLGITETRSKNKNGSYSPVFSVSWQDDNGKQHISSFSINKHGREKALELAIEFRKQKDAEKLKRHNVELIDLGTAKEMLERKWRELITSFEFSTAEEVSDSKDLFEGTVYQIVVNAYERNPEARLKCISHYGSVCFICGFDFGKAYGKDGEGIIHVHHLTPLSSIGAEYQVDPIKDMRPVCPNCHVVIHKKEPPLSVEKVREIVNYQKEQVLND